MTSCLWRCVGALVLVGAMQTGCATKKVIDVTFDETRVADLFQDGTLLYHVDPEEQVVYVDDRDKEKVAGRLGAVPTDDGHWQIQFGPLEGTFDVADAGYVDEDLRIREFSVSGINGYTCVDVAAGTCLRVDGTNDSLKLVNPDTICATPSSVCDTIWRNILVDYYANDPNCKGDPVRRMRNTALCIKP